MVHARDQQFQPETASPIFKVSITEIYLDFLKNYFLKTQKVRTSERFTEYMRGGAYFVKEVNELEARFIDLKLAIANEKVSYDMVAVAAKGLSRQYNSLATHLLTGIPQTDDTNKKMPNVQGIGLSDEKKKKILQGLETIYKGLPPLVTEMQGPEVPFTVDGIKDSLTKMEKRELLEPTLPKIQIPK